MSSWTQNLQELRTRELETAFKGCPEKIFGDALELGAGSGFQSSLLARYAKHLISTELNAERFHPHPIAGVEYRICDAELVGDIFPRGTFDLVFASNLMEHVPHPERALGGIRSVLAPGGIAILVMPNVLWKAFSLAGFYPNACRLFARALAQGRAVSLVKRYARRRTGSPGKIKGNNLKSPEPEAARAGILWPSPHGAYASHSAEFKAYGKRAWLNRFAAAGFDTIAIRKGPISSGYGFGLHGLRRLLERAGLTTEYIYVLAVQGESSSYARYWTSPSGKA